MDDFLNFKDKLNLGQQSQVYLDNLLKYVQILYYSQELDDERITEAVRFKITPMFSILADEMSKMVDEYQEKHGEI